MLNLRNTNFCSSQLWQTTSTFQIFSIKVRTIQRSVRPSIIIPAIRNQSGLINFFVIWNDFFCKKRQVRFFHPSLLSYLVLEYIDLKKKTWIFMFFAASCFSSSRQITILSPKCFVEPSFDHNLETKVATQLFRMVIVQLSAKDISKQSRVIVSAKCDCDVSTATSLVSRTLKTNEVVALLNLEH